MPADYFRADENGDGVDDPSEASPTTHFGDLNHPDSRKVRAWAAQAGNGTNGLRHRVLFVVDARTVQDSEHPLMAVDAREEPGREFRLIPSAVQVVGDNVNTGNMRFREFVDQADPDGIFRHY